MNRTHQKYGHHLLLAIFVSTVGLLTTYQAMLTSRAMPGGQEKGGRTKTPPEPRVNEDAAARAERASRSRSRPASTSDQVELAIKRGNAAMNKLEVEDALPHSGLKEDEKVRLRAQAASNYQRALQLNPKDWRVFYGIGSLYAYEKRYADAAAAHERAVALRPRDPDLQIVLGDVYAADSRHVDAIRAYAKSIELDPSPRNEFAYSRLAMTYERAELIDEAVQTYKRLQLIKPAESFYWQVGRLYEKQKQYDQAIEAYKSQIKLYPNDPNGTDAYEKLGHLYTVLRRFSEAIDSYRNQLLQSPKKISTLQAIGEAFLEVNDIPSAREKQKELAIAERKVYGDVSSASKLLMKHIILAEQIQELRQEIQANPRDADKHFRMGNAYLEWRGLWGLPFGGHYAEAIEHYKEAIRLEPNQPAAHFNLGLAYLYSGNRSAAMEQYNSLRQLNSEYADELLNAIKR